MKPKQHIFIDDSGDTGFTSSRSQHFVIACVVIVDSEKKDLLDKAIELFRRNQGWRDEDEMKFHKTNKQTVKKLLGSLKDFDYSVYAMVLDKTTAAKLTPKMSKTSLYNFTIKELLMKLRLDEPVISIDGVGGKKYIQKVRAYLRQNLKEKGVVNCQIKFVDSKKDYLIQFADIVAGSIARSFQKDRKDSGDYIGLIGKKIKKIYFIDKTE
jgi:uncharacterized protein (DUF4415 family)